MKILLLTGFGGFTHRFHVLSRNILKDFPKTEISVLVFGLQTYKLLKNQKEVKYKEIISIDKLKESFSDEKLDLEFIKRFEELYGEPFMTNILYSDRSLIPITHHEKYKIKFSHDEILQSLQVIGRRLELLIDNSDIILSYTPASLETLLLYRICNVKNIPYYNLIKGRVNRFMITDNPYEESQEVKDDFFASRNEQIDDKEINKFVKKTLDGVKSKQYHAQKKVRNDLSIIKAKKKIVPSNIVRFIKNILRKEQITSTMIKSKKQRIIDNILYHFRLNKIKKTKLFTNQLPKQPYVFFPLHFMPESTILIFATEYYDQLAIIKQIALNLPVQWKLVVKEHPMMIGVTPINFYNEISRIPNVVLLHPNFSSIECIQSADTVITITGTVGLESLALGKRTVVLGKTIFSFLPSIKKIKIFSDLKNILKTPITEADKLQSIKDVNQFMASIYRQSFPDSDKILWSSKAETVDQTEFDKFLYNNFKIILEKRLKEIPNK